MTAGIRGEKNIESHQMPRWALMSVCEVWSLCVRYHNWDTLFNRVPIGSAMVRDILKLQSKGMSYQLSTFFQNQSDWLQTSIMGYHFNL